MELERDMFERIQFLNWLAGWLGEVGLMAR